MSTLQNFKNRIFQSLNKYKPIGAMLLVGFLVRLVLAPYTSVSFDFEVWYIAFVNIVSGLGTPYPTMYFSYPPVWGSFMIPFASGSLLLSNPYQLGFRGLLNGSFAVSTHPLFTLLVKLPIFLAEIFIGLIIFSYVLERKSLKVASKAFALWFLNPLVILIGAIDGQIDALAALLLLLAFCFVLQRKYFFGGLSLSLGALTKIFPVYLLPLFLLLMIKPDLETQEENVTKRFSLRIIAERYAPFLGGLLIGVGFVFLPLILVGSLS